MLLLWWGSMDWSVYSVAQRTHEIEIRMALGARSPQVFRLVIGHSITLTLLGIVASGQAAVGITRFIATLLIGISSTEPPTFALVPVALLSATTLASVIPARRALRVDPLEALSLLERRHPGSQNL